MPVTLSFRHSTVMASSSSPVASESHPPFAWWAVGALLGGAFGIGFAPIFAKLGRDVGQISPLATAFWRMALAAPVMGVVAWIFTRQAREADLPDADSGTEAPGTGRPLAIWWLMLPGVWFAADIAVWHWSFEFTSVANATVLANTAMIITPIVGFLFLGERAFDWKFPLGVALALTGVVLLVRASTAGLAAGPDPLLGDALGLATAIFYAGYLITMKRIRAHAATAILIAISSATAAGVLLVVCLASGQTILPVPDGWGPLIGLALVSHCGGQGLIALSLRHLPVSLASVMLLSQTIITAILGYLILGQQLAPQQLMAGSLILCGLAAAILGHRRAARSPVGPTVRPDSTLATATGDNAAAAVGPSPPPTS